MSEHGPIPSSDESAISMLYKIMGIAVATGAVAVGGAIAKKQFDKRHELKEEKPDETV
jgi:hypothetical protein